jgi:hypothetical protein
MSFFSRVLRRFYLDSSSKRFIAFNRSKWKPIKAEKESTILVDVFDWNPFIYCASHTAQYLANLTGSSIESFSLAGGLSNRLGCPFYRLQRIYESFGAKLTLRKTHTSAKPFKKEAQAMADKILSAVNSKEDVLEISLEGTKIGHLVYDTYLRRLGKPTLDIKDSKLKKVIEEACLNWLLVKKYFSERDVKAILTSHYVYIEHGILVTLAGAMNIPVFIFFNEFDLLLLEMSTKTHLQVRHYWDYKSIFSNLDRKAKETYLKMAKKMLEDRLSGIRDKGTKYYLTQGTPDLSGYGATSSTHLLKDTGIPRILILLNCFFDAPHGYRYLLFPDMWEWLNFLLTKASDTPFDWYVKPHPSGMVANDAIVEDFKKRFPKINFLGRTASNAQIVAEGINAMFTTYGTAGHEFAYMGVPVVTAGDNPHINYDFNFHPKNVEEYEEYVQKAGYLKAQFNKDEILEFFSVHYFDSYKPNSFNAHLIDSELGYEVLGTQCNELLMLDKYIAGETPEKLERVKAYLDYFFKSYFPKKKTRQSSLETFYQKGP